MLHPWWSVTGSAEHRDRLMRRLTGSPGVVLVDLSDMTVSEADVIRMGCDQHPNRGMADRIAQRLVPELEKVAAH